MQTSDSPAKAGSSGELDGGIVEYLPDGSTIPEGVWGTRHAYFIALILVHVPALFAIGLFEGTESLVTGMTLPSVPLWRLLLQMGIIVALALSAAVPRLNRRLRTVLAVTGLAFCSGTLVHVTGGYIEAHFHFFVAIGIAAIYEDWLPFGIGIAYVVATHGIFGMVDPASVYNHPAAQMNPWVWGFIHGGFVAMLAGALTVHLSSIEKSRRSTQNQLQRAQKRATRIDDLEQRQAEIEREKRDAEQLKAEAERLNQHLERKTTAYQRAMERAANGDLTVRVDPESENEVMTDIGKSFNAMLVDLEDTVLRVRSFADEVAESSEEVTTGAEESQSASEQVSESIRSISTDADAQSESLQEVADEMQSLSGTVEEVASSADEVAVMS